MHIPDGVLHPLVCAGGFAISGAAAAVALRDFREERIPELGVLTGLFFVASTIPIPLGVASVHLLLFGLLGIVLGWLSVLSLLVALSFQAVLVGHGGLTTIGVNGVVAASGALASHALFQSLRRIGALRDRCAIVAFLSTLVGFLAASAVFLTLMSTAKETFLKLGTYVILFHLPVIVVECLVTAWTVSFLMKVKPEILEPHLGAP